MTAPRGVIAALPASMQIAFRLSWRASRGPADANRLAQVARAAQNYVSAKPQRQSQRWRLRATLTESRNNTIAGARAP